MGNSTTNTLFILVGFSFFFDVQVTLFAGFLLVYVITLLGNLTVIFAIVTTPKLHTPMYFFLCILSSLDIVTVTVIVPRMLRDQLSQKKHIAFNECITQVFLTLLLEFTDAFILTAMCFDRYAAICHPLTYTILMSRRLCIYLCTLCFIGGIVCSFINTFLVSQLRFRVMNKIDNLFCELPALLRLASDDTLPNEIALFTVAGGGAVVTFSVIFLSYMHIIRVILKIPSREGKRKVFSTCSAHLLVVCLFFGVACATHFTPTSSQKKPDKLASLFYTVFVPMLNPIIYSLRNEDVKQALKRLIYHS